MFMWKKIRYHLLILFGCFTISFLFLMIASKSSFLYHMNDWYDANCYFTIGRGMLKGKILYQDLFDQKGPLLFFLHMIAAMISSRTFFGVFLLEVFSFTIFLYYAQKTVCLFLKKEYNLYFLPIFCCTIFTLPAFSHGDSAEEFCLPLFMYSLYALTNYLKKKQWEKPCISMLLKNGIVAGMVFTIKYTIIGFWFAWMMCLFFLLIQKKEYQHAFLSCIIFLVGMSIPIFPWIIYFTYHDAFDAMINSYFLFNLKYYPSHISLLLKSTMILEKPFRFFASNLEIGIPTLLSIISIWINQKHFPKISSKLILTTCFLFLWISVFCGGVSFRYYYLILTPFSIFGWIEIFSWLNAYYHPKFLENKLASFVIIMTISLYLCFYGSPNVGSMKLYQEKEDYAQFIFSEIINKQKNPTLLNYHFLDGGFYTAANVIPTTRYFQKQNVDHYIYPTIQEEQDKLVQNKKIDFVITRECISCSTHTEYPAFLFTNYRIKKSKTQTYEEKRYRYRLWKKRAN